jgi:prevent-host-death family protein
MASRKGHDCDVAYIPPRELRNNTSEVWRRVEEGERLTVTVNGRGVAQLVPLPRRPRFLPAEQLLAHPADPGPGKDLEDLLGDDTLDDVEAPWDKAAHRGS